MQRQVHGQIAIEGIVVTKTWKQNIIMARAHNGQDMVVRIVVEGSKSFKLHTH